MARNIMSGQDVLIIGILAVIFLAVFFSGYSLGKRVTREQPPIQSDEMATVFLRVDSLQTDISMIKDYILYQESEQQNSGYALQ